MMTEEEIFKILADAGVGWDDPDDPDAPKIPLYGDGDADKELPAARAMEAYFGSQLREAQSSVLALRKVLEDEEAMLSSNPYPPTLGPQAFLRHRMLQDLLAMTSATAQRVKDEIERDVREAVWDKVKDMWGASPMQFRAAILGEKENN